MNQNIYHHIYQKTVTQFLNDWPNKSLSVIAYKEGTSLSPLIGVSVNISSLKCSIQFKSFISDITFIALKSYSESWSSPINFPALFKKRLSIPRFLIQIPCFLCFIFYPGIPFHCMRPKSSHLAKAHQLKALLLTIFWFFYFFFSNTFWMFF